jgi:hypothetical protein
MEQNRWCRSRPGWWRHSWPPLVWQHQGLPVRTRGELPMKCSYSLPVTDNKARICNRLWRPGINYEKSISLAYVVWRAGTKNRVVVLARQAGNRFRAPQMFYKYGLWIFSFTRFVVGRGGGGVLKGTFFTDSNEKKKNIVIIPVILHQSDENLWQFWASTSPLWVSIVLHGYILSLHSSYILDLMRIPILFLIRISYTL